MPSSISIAARSGGTDAIKQQHANDNEDERTGVPTGESYTKNPTTFPRALTKHSISSIRIQPSSSSFLRSGANFQGTQQSGRATYEVGVQLKYVDIKQSFLCGHLRIQGLTEDNPTLTTYFEGEIIGPKHSFITRKEEWGATERVDIEHWARFPPFRPLARSVKKPGFQYRDVLDRDHVFMRWKELHILGKDGVSAAGSRVTTAAL